MKALIFGSNGQDGYYLNQILIKEGVEVVTISRSNASICGNVADHNFVQDVIKQHQPDYIFHFAQGKHLVIRVG